MTTSEHQQAQRWTRSNRTLAVPLARRILLSDKRRLVRSISGIAFAALLMMVELGFRNAFIDRMLLALRQLDADVFLIGKVKYEFGRNAPFPRRRLSQARAQPKVVSARPLYAERTASLWKNPQTHQTYSVQVYVFDPGEPVFLLPEETANLAALRRPDTLMADRRALRSSPLVGSSPRTRQRFFDRADLHRCILCTRRRTT